MTVMLVIAIVSGIIPIAIGHTAFHYAQKYLGSSLCSSIALFNPLLTYAVVLGQFGGDPLGVAGEAALSLTRSLRPLIAYVGSRADPIVKWVGSPKVVLA